MSDVCISDRELTVNEMYTIRTFFKNSQIEVNI